MNPAPGQAGGSTKEDLMRRLSRLVSVAVVSLCLLMLAASMASANRALRVEPAGPITKVVEEFTVIAFGGEVQIRCRLTVRGNIAAVINKAAARVLPEGRIGQIREAATEGCRTNFGGVADLTVLVEPLRPVNLRYEMFLGGLPNITGILISKLRFEFKIEAPLVLGVCLYSGQVGLLIAFPPVEERGRRFNNESFNTPNAIPFVVGDVLCPGIVEISGRGRLMPPQRLTLL